MTFKWIMNVAIQTSSTIIAPLMFYLIYISSPLKYKGTFIGIYLGIISIANLTMGYLVNSLENNIFLLLILIPISVFAYLYIKAENEITLPNKPQ